MLEEDWISFYSLTGFPRIEIKDFSEGSGKIIPEVFQGSDFLEELISYFSMNSKTNSLTPEIFTELLAQWLNNFDSNSSKNFKIVYLTIVKIILRDFGIQFLRYHFKLNSLNSSVARRKRHLIFENFLYLPKIVNLFSQRLNKIDVSEMPLILMQINRNPTVGGIFSIVFEKEWKEIISKIDGSDLSEYYSIVDFSVLIKANLDNLSYLSLDTIKDIYGAYIGE